MPYDYTKKDIVKSLHKLNISKGDILFSHFNLGFFGIPEGGMTEENLFNIFYEAIFEVIGKNGVLVVPTFTYSFKSNSSDYIFDYDNDATSMGFFPEMIRKHPRSIRTLDPIFSCSLIGNIKKLFPNNIITSTEILGDGSIWDIMLKKKAKLCNFNLSSGFSTFLHYCEKKCNVPYRKNFTFSGITKVNDASHIQHNVTFFARDLSLKYDYDTKEYSKYMIDNGYEKRVKLGRGSIVVTSYHDSYNAFNELYNINPYFFTKQKKELV